MDRERGQARIYQIEVQGHLDDDWSEWLAGFDIVPQENGTTVLMGPVLDQPALHGLLNRIRDLGLVLLSVKRVEACPSVDRRGGKTVT